MLCVSAVPAAREMKRGALQTGGVEMSFAQRCLRLVTGWLLVTAMVVESLCVMGAELAVSTDFESGSRLGF